jgi:cAMP phosphodiesterase
MRIHIVDPSLGAGDGRYYAASFVVDASVAIDAGELGFLSPLEHQKRIGHVFLSHSHLDHIGSLPLFLDNVYEPGAACPTVYGSAPVLECLRIDFFNDRVWPDLFRLSQEETPFLRTVLLEPRIPVVVGNLRITPIALDHSVPTMGFIIEDDETAVATIWDTLPTAKIWEVLNTKSHLKAVFLEAAFPDSLEWLARKSKHLTPAMLRDEMRKLARRVPVIAVQIKPAFHERVVADLQALGLADLEIGTPGATYVF